LGEKGFRLAFVIEQRGVVSAVLVYAMQSSVFADPTYKKVRQAAENEGLVYAPAGRLARR
jgi:hypothetical protein